MYLARSARAHWGSNDRSVAHPSECFLGGVPAIGTCSGRHWAVHFWPTAHQSPYYHIFLGPKPETGQVIGGRWLMNALCFQCSVLLTSCVVCCCVLVRTMFLCTYSLAPGTLVSLLC